MLTRFGQREDSRRSGLQRGNGNEECGVIAVKWLYQIAARIL